jgi:hypothetical protein
MHVTQHPKFAEVADLLARLRAEQELLTAEYQAALEALAMAPTSAALSLEERARIVLDGGAPGTASDARRAEGERELAIRERLVLLPRVIEELATRLEIIRELARGELLAKEPIPPALWEQARKAVEAAVAAERERRARVVSGGYGTFELQAPDWLREAAWLR